MGQGTQKKLNKAWLIHGNLIINVRFPANHKMKIISLVHMN
jgi:hypothetical protein